MSNKKRIIEVLRKGKPAEKISIQGWVRTKRELKEFAFMEVSDGSSLANLQVILNQDLPHYENVIKRLNTGVSVVVEGILVESPAKGQTIELQASQVDICGDCDPETYPLQKNVTPLNF